MSKMTTETRDRLMWMAHVVNQALVTDDEEVARVALGDILHEAGMAGAPAHSADVATGRVSETRPYSGEFFTPKSVLDALNGTPAHSADVATEPEKKRTNLEFCGLKLARYAYKDNTLYVGKRDLRPCGEKEVFKITARRIGDGSTGDVYKNKKWICAAGGNICLPMLERFMIGGLHAVLKRKENQQRRKRARRKAKRAAKSAAHSADRLHDREGM